MPNKAGDIDWLKATEDERILLHRLTVNLAATLKINAETLLEDILDTKLSATYMDNARKGKMRKAYAKQVYEWVVEHHFEKARELAPDLFKWPNTDVWEQYIELHAIKGRLRIARLTDNRDIIQPLHSLPKNVEQLKLGEPFCFELDSSIDGLVIGYQEYSGKWHPLPLGQGGIELHSKVISKKQLLPLYEDGEPVEMIEAHDVGLHRFIVIVTPHNAFTSSDENSFPPTLDETSILHVLQVHVVP